MIENLDSLPPPIGEVAIHQVVAQKMKLFRRMQDDEPKPKDVQMLITTSSNNALSWLFGKGFEYWRSNDTETIMRDFKVPDEMSDTIESLKRIFDNIPEDELFGAKNFANFHREP